MEILTFSLNATLPVVLCMALGILLRWRRAIDQDLAGRLSSLCFNVFLPVLTFKNVFGIDFDAEFSPGLLLYGFLGILLVVAVLLLILIPLYKRDMAWVAAAAHVGYRSNYVMFGIPMAQSMFGETGVRIASMLIPVAVIPFNFITVLLFSLAEAGKGDTPGKLMRKTLLNIIHNPLIIASLLGLCASLLRLNLPQWADATLQNLSGVASPLCLVVLGSQITLSSLSEDKRRIIALCVTRLLLVPIAMVGGAVALGFRGPELGALFVLFASPCANSCVIMAYQYNVKPEFTAQVVGITTVLSGLTTFAGISLLRFFSLF